MTVGRRGRHRRRICGARACRYAGRRKQRGNTWLGALVRQTDSGLLDEWERLASGVAADTAPVQPPPPAELTASVRAYTVLVRNAMFRRVELAALRRYHDLGGLDEAAGWDADRWHDAIEAYFTKYDGLGTGGDARKLTFMDRDQHRFGPKALSGREMLMRCQGLEPRTR
jgi:hypothetical protein